MMGKTQNSSVVDAHCSHAKMDYVPLANKLQELKQIRQQRNQQYETKHRPQIFKLIDAQIQSQTPTMTRNSLQNFLDSSMKLTNLSKVVSPSESENLSLPKLENTRVLEKMDHLGEYFGKIQVGQGQQKKRVRNQKSRYTSLNHHH